MDVALFVPCYVDQLYPRAGLAAAAVLEGCGCRVSFDDRQTCCGQPMANCGCASDAARLARRHLDLFRGKVTVSPSGSCVGMVRGHYQELGLTLDDEDRRTIANTFELCEFLVLKLGVERVAARFPHKVSVQRSCHGLRELGLGSPSERTDGRGPSPAERLLAGVEGLTLLVPERADECCGFGGTFAVTEDAVSARMGRDRCAAHAATGAEFITGSDWSCGMHLDGIRRKQGSGPPFIHVAEILASR
jgi:L-lactate dehydrogenase complex protein LldE